MKKHNFELTGQTMKQVNKQSAIVADVSNIQLGGFFNMKFSYFKIWANLGLETCVALQLFKKNFFFRN